MLVVAAEGLVDMEQEGKVFGLVQIRLFRRGVGDLGELRGELNMPLWSLYMNPTKGF